MFCDEIFTKIEMLLCEASTADHSNWNHAINNFHTISILFNKISKEFINGKTAIEDIIMAEQKRKILAQAFENNHSTFFNHVVNSTPKNLQIILEAEIKEVIAVRKSINKLEGILCRTKYCSIIEQYLSKDQRAQKYFCGKSSADIIQELSVCAKQSVKRYITITSTDDTIMSIQTALDWVEKSFPEYRREMKSVAWLELHKKYGDIEIDTDKAEKELDSLLKSKQVSDNTNAFEYVILSQKKVQI